MNPRPMNGDTIANTTTPASARAARRYSTVVAASTAIERPAASGNSVFTAQISEAARV